MPLVRTHKRKKNMSPAYNHDLSKLPGLAHGQTYNADNPFERKFFVI